jgi:hypothetical protein
MGIYTKSSYVNHTLRIIPGIRGRLIPHIECQEYRMNVTHHIQSSHSRTPSHKSSWFIGTRNVVHGTWNVNLKFPVHKGVYFFGTMVRKPGTWTNYFWYDSLVQSSFLSELYSYNNHVICCVHMLSEYKINSRINWCGQTPKINYDKAWNTTSPLPLNYVPNHRPLTCSNTSHTSFHLMYHVVPVPDSERKFPVRGTWLCTTFPVTGHVHTKEYLNYQFRTSYIFVTHYKYSAKCIY